MRQPRLSSVFLPVKGETAVPVDVKSSQGRRRAVCVFPPNLFIYNSQLVPFSLGSVWPHKTLQPSRMQGSSAQPGVAAPPPGQGPCRCFAYVTAPVSSLCNADSSLSSPLPNSLSDLISAWAPPLRAWKEWGRKRPGVVMVFLVAATTGPRPPGARGAGQALPHVTRS